MQNCIENKNVSCYNIKLYNRAKIKKKKKLNPPAKTSFAGKKKKDYQP